MWQRDRQSPVCRNGKNQIWLFRQTPELHGRAICQRLTGKIEESYSNAAMQRGTELEPVAREMYLFNQFDAEVTEVGFIPHPEIVGFGASSDGLVGNDGLIKIKCHNTWTHLETIKIGKPKQQYLLQMHAQMMCTGRNGGVESGI
ncbi:MAG: YqaJ viral recombinase family protein [Symbiopectobacterium sp.]